MDARMISFWGCETNPCVNPDTANNGGGYSQPSGGIFVALENGDYLTVTVDDGRRWGGCYGTMDDAMVDNEWTEESLDSVSGVYGIDARAMLLDAIHAVHIAA